MSFSATDMSKYDLIGNFVLRRFCGLVRRFGATRDSSPSKMPFRFFFLFYHTDPTQELGVSVLDSIRYSSLLSTLYNIKVGQ